MDHAWIYKNTPSHVVLWKHHDLKKLCRACSILSNRRAGEGTDHRLLTWCTVVRNCSCPLFTVSSCEVDFFFLKWEEWTVCHDASYLSSVASVHLSARLLENFPWLQVLVLKFCFATGGKMHRHTIWTFLAYFSNLWSSKSVLEPSMMEIVVNIVN